MSDLKNHPRVPEDTPCMNRSGSDWSFSVSWAEDELPLAEAYLYDDVYTVVGSMCFWIAHIGGEQGLADQWLDWMEKCNTRIKGLTS